MRKLFPLVASALITVALFAGAEIAVRLLGIAPGPWPSADLPIDFPQIHNDPLLGPLPAPGWSGDWTGSGSFATQVDARGFRASGAAPPEHALSRVAFLGDSCTFGWEVSTPETFVARLDAMQRRGEKEPAIELINAAYPGQSAVVGEYMLRERVLPLDPDVVVIGYSANNAFRFSLVRDQERFRFFSLRKLLLKSRLVQIAASAIARRRPRPGNPRDSKAVHATDFEHLHRVASVDEFAAALRAMIHDARAAGARPLLLLLPRACESSKQFPFEDPAPVPGSFPLKARTDGAPFNANELGLIERSCLDHRALADPVATLIANRPGWKRVFPRDDALLDLLEQGASAYAAGDPATARRLFARAIENQPDAPLALYDRGVVEVLQGEREGGIRDLRAAARLSCNVFTQYKVVAWEIASELDVPVADLTLRFQAHVGEKLFLDPAHPTPAGHELIARELWPLLQKELAAAPGTARR